MANETQSHRFASAVFGLFFLSVFLLGTSLHAQETAIDSLAQSKKVKGKQTEATISKPSKTKGMLRVLNETKTPKLFTLSMENEFKVRVTLSGNKDYFLEPGEYQLSYYSPLTAKQISRYVTVKVGEMVKVVFRKTGKLDADFFIE
ncbi:MAG: hypothetical protein SFU91_04530 [Chloroherpetonaceae bacterium]|nr:hypothetical protein [Chloroherpetonaceae bacterium]